MYIKVIKLHITYIGSHKRFRKQTENSMKKSLPAHVPFYYSMTNSIFISLKHKTSTLNYKHASVQWAQILSGHLHHT